MPLVKPFKALRPTKESAPSVASPPYDVLSSEEAKELVKDNPHSFLRVNKPEVDFASGITPTAEEINEKGKENLNLLISNGKLVQEKKEALYLYRLTWQEKSQTGLACLCSVEDYVNGLIKKHENTRPSKVSDRLEHMLYLGAQVGPVFSIFEQNEDIESLFEKLTSSQSEIDFVARDDIRHQLWVIDNSDDTDAISDAFLGLDFFYIADGHHRSEAAYVASKRMKAINPDHTGNETYNFFLNVIFPDSELRILPYNRVVKDLKHDSLEQFLDSVSEFFLIANSSEEVELDTLHQFGIYSQGKWYKLTCKPESFDENNPANSIDSNILYENLLKPILGIEDIRTDSRIDFIGGIRGNKELVKLVDSGSWSVAFSLNPVSVKQLLNVANASEVMPPKSTWFEPKLRSGMVINLF